MNDLLIWAKVAKPSQFIFVLIVCGLSAFFDALAFLVLAAFLAGEQVWLTKYIPQYFLDSYVVLGMFFFRVILYFFQNYFVSLFSQDIYHRLIIKLLFSDDFKNNRSVQILNKRDFVKLVMRDLYQVSQVSGILISLVVELFILLGMLAGLIFMTSEFEISVFSVAMFGAVIIFYGFKIILRNMSQRIEASHQYILGFVTDLSGFVRVARFSTFPLGLKGRFEDALVEFGKSNAFGSGYNSSAKPLLEFFGVLMLTMLMVTVGSESESQSYLVAVGALSVRILPALGRIITGLGQISLYSQSIQLVREAFRQNEDASAAEGTRSVVFGDGGSRDDHAIQFPRIIFEYRQADGIDRQRFVFDSCSFPLGSRVLIHGPSGSGKSTYIKCLIGAVGPQNSCIKIEDRFVCDSEVAYVPQDVGLFAGSIEENICFGSAGNPRELNRIVSVLFPNNEIPVSYVLENEGRNLSGGQKIRVAIARALYRQATVLILDEPTAALSLDSGLEIMNLISDRQFGFKLLLVVSHQSNINQYFDYLVDVSAAKV